MEIPFALFFSFFCLLAPLKLCLFLSAPFGLPLLLLRPVLLGLEPRERRKEEEEEERG